MAGFCRSIEQISKLVESGVLRSSVVKAIRDLSSGKPVLIFDSPTRESEIDMVYYAGFVGVDEVYYLRTLAGGLICYATSRTLGDVLGLKYMQELLESQGYSRLIKRPRYGDVSPFSIYVNHISVRTGISDLDRALTIKELHRVIELAMLGRIDEARSKFYTEFYAPGHVPVLLARQPTERRGHTELAVALSSMAGLHPSVVFAEMLDRGVSLELSKAERLAAENGYSLISGDEIIEAWDVICG